MCRSTLTNPGNGCQPVNLFGLNQFSAAARNYLYGTAYQSQDYIQNVVAANVQGDLLHTWAGPINNHVAGAVYFALGARYRLPFMKPNMLEVYGSVENLLNRNPPVAPSNQGSTNNILFDPLGRDFRLGIRASF